MINKKQRNAGWISKKPAGRRRAYLKKYKSTGVDINKINAHEIFQNKARVRSVAISKGQSQETEPILNNTFMQEIPETIIPRTTNALMDIPRVQAQLTREKEILSVWQSERMTGFEKYVSAILEKDNIKTLRVYISGDKRIFEIEYANKVRMRSRVYSSSQKAAEARNNGTIDWDEIIDPSS
jgi:hypothetical protein